VVIGNQKPVNFSARLWHFNSFATISERPPGKKRLILSACPSRLRLICYRVSFAGWNGVVSSLQTALTQEFGGEQLSRRIH
jgi:hypothetical protein